MTTDLDRALQRIARLEGELNQLRLRVGALEDFIEQRFEPPARPSHEPPRVDAGHAVTLGSALSETRGEIRSAKESARNLRRVISPENDTGRHVLQADEMPPEETPWKK